MCGIAGVIGQASRDGRLLSNMARAIAHRGPDDEGVWADRDAGVGLCNRRLAIIDLSPAGHQPMQSADGRWVLTFNGEIYNHAELRAALERKGFVPLGGWRGHSDTETFLEAIAAWGLLDTLRLSAGMFAFALWDRRERRLSLGRDRFGEKPLYYGWAGRDFLFASEIKSIREHPQFGGAIDRDALGLYAARNYVPAPFSIYRGIFKLEPACVLELDQDAASTPLASPPRRGACPPGIRIHSYWSYLEILRSGLEEPIADEQEAMEKLDEALATAVRSQSVTDVPVGAFLSGGIDSSTIVSVYQKYSSCPVRTFTIGFNEAAFDEAANAKAVARHLGTDHFERIVTASEAREIIPGLPQIYDEPFADSSQIPTYLVSKLAREQVKVALSGDGGDELFGGYNRYFAAARAWTALNRVPRPMRAAAARLLGRVDARFWTALASAVSRRPAQPHYGVKVRKWLRTIAGARTLDDIFTTFLNEWAGLPTPVRGAADGDLLCPFSLDLGTKAPDALRMMYCDAVTYLPDDILCKVDRASMAVGLEVHVPFLDHRVAELAARIPMSLKIRAGTGKYILRRALSREVPRGLFERPKTGFGIPVGEWIKGPLRPWAEDLLDPRRMAEEGWFDPRPVQRRWRDHLEGRQDSTAAIWSVLMFQAWLREQRGQSRQSAAA